MYDILRLQQARDLLNKYIDNTLEIKASNHDDTYMEKHNDDSSSAFYLFRRAPPGLSDEHPREGKYIWMVVFGMTEINEFQFVNISKC